MISLKVNYLKRNRTIIRNFWFRKVLLSLAKLLALPSLIEISLKEWKLLGNITRSSFQIRVSERCMQRTWVWPSLPSQSLSATTPKAIKRFKPPTKNSLKVILLVVNVGIERKTIVFDIDETLVYASYSQAEYPPGSIDTSIRIKVNRFGGSQKAYLSFRPYLFEMLREL
jgi:hypothetical protein